MMLSGRARSSLRRTAAPRSAGGFTLVEILIVVVLLAILAAMVLPQFTSATEQTRENTLNTNLQRIRQQIELYRHHHHGRYPSVENFVDQLTKASNAAGQVGAANADYRYGPYVNHIPDNPYTNGNTVSDGDVATSDWYYNPDTGDFHANHTEAARDL